MSTQSYRWYVVGLMTLTYAFNLADRVLISVMLEPIKAEFSLSDTLMGFFGGGLYAYTYALFSIPLGWLCDRVNRRNLLAACLAAWSLMTVLSGFTRSIFQLGMAQSMVAVAESGSPPAMNSLISDLFARKERGLPLSVWFMGVSMGYFLGYALGGHLADAYGWRMAFVILGVPGIVLAVLIRLTMRETARGAADGGANIAAPTLSATFAFFRSQVSLRHAIYATCLLGLGFMGPNYWMTAFFVRSHEVSLSEAGAVIGVVMGVSGIIGAPLGGLLVDRLSRRDVRWPPRLASGLLATSVLPMSLLYLSESTTVAYAACFVLAMLTTMVPIFLLTLISNLAAAQFRGLSVSIMLLLMMAFGYGLGSQLVGLASDLFSNVFDLGNDSLRYASLSMGVFALWGAVHFWVIGRHARAGYAEAVRLEQSSATA